MENEEVILAADNNDISLSPTSVKTRHPEWVNNIKSKEAMDYYYNL